MYNLDLIKEVARGIIHCGDYGELFWNQSEQKIFWCFGDSDSDEEGGYTSLNEIEELFLSVPFVNEVEVEPETYPIDSNAPDGTDGWVRIDYERN